MKKLLSITILLAFVAGCAPGALAGVPAVTPDDEVQKMTIIPGPDEVAGDADEARTFDSAKYNKWGKSTNFVKGIEALRDFEYATAAEYFTKELKQHPQNGYALANQVYSQWRDNKIKINAFLINNLYPDEGEEANINDIQARYDKMLEENNKIYSQWLPQVDKALKLIPAADKETRFNILFHLKDDLLVDLDADGSERIACIKEAVQNKLDADACSILISLYLSDGNYAEAQQLYDNTRQAILYGSDIPLSFARYELDSLQHYDRALEILNDDVLAAYPDNAEALKLRMGLNYINGNYPQALADVLAIADADDGDPYTPLYRVGLISPAATAAVLDTVTLRAQQLMSLPDSVLAEYSGYNWPLIEGMLYGDLKGDYRTAIDKITNSKVVDITALNSELFKKMAYYHFALGRVDDASFFYDLLQRATNDEFESEDSGASATAEEDDEIALTATPSCEAMHSKIEMMMNCGMVEQVLHEAQVLELMSDEDTDQSYVHYARGWAYYTLKDYDKAYESFDKWNEIYGGENATAQYWQARCLLAKGNSAQAKQELEQLLGSEYAQSSMEFRMNLLYYLGRTGEARDLLTTLEKNTEQVRAMTIRQAVDSGEMLPEVMSDYNLACSFALHNDADKALYYLKRHYDEIESDDDARLNYGWTLLDSDFDNLLDLPAFKNLVEDYRQRWLSGNYKPTRHYSQQ